MRQEPEGGHLGSDADSSCGVTTDPRRCPTRWPPSSTVPPSRRVQEQCLIGWAWMAIIPVLLMVLLAVAVYVAVRFGSGRRGLTRDAARVLTRNGLSLGAAPPPPATPHRRFGAAGP